MIKSLVSTKIGSKGFYKNLKVAITLTSIQKEKKDVWKKVYKDN
jgi:hypothetical protein